MVYSSPHPRRYCHPFLGVISPKFFCQEFSCDFVILGYILWNFGMFVTVWFALGLFVVVCLLHILCGFAYLLAVFWFCAFVFFLYNLLFRFVFMV